MRCRILSMAYRNHPTRYLIVKDRVAQATRPPFPATCRRWETTRSRRPGQALFFKSRPPFASGPCRGFPLAEESFYTSPQAPSTLFFNPRRLAATRPFPVSRSGGELLRSPARPVNAFFQIPSKRRCPSIRVAASRCGLTYLADPARPVNTFFQVPLRNRPVTRIRTARTFRSTYPGWTCQHPFCADLPNRPAVRDPLGATPALPAGKRQAFPHPPLARQQPKRGRGRPDSRRPGQSRPAGDRPDGRTGNSCRPGDKEGGA